MNTAPLAAEERGAGDTTVPPGMVDVISVPSGGAAAERRCARREVRIKSNHGEKEYCIVRGSQVREALRCEMRFLRCLRTERRGRRRSRRRGRYVEVGTSRLVHRGGYVDSATRRQPTCVKISTLPLKTKRPYRTSPTLFFEPNRLCYHPLW